MKKYFMWALAIGFCLGGSCLTSCTDDDGNGNGGGNEPPVPADTDEAYVIAATVDDASVPDETVAEVYQKGYKMGSKVLRPAMVTVTSGGPKREKAPDEGTEDKK